MAGLENISAIQPGTQTVLGLNPSLAKTHLPAMWPSACFLAFL